MMAPRRRGRVAWLHRKKQYQIDHQGSYQHLRTEREQPELKLGMSAQLLGLADQTVLWLAWLSRQEEHQQEL